MTDDELQARLRRLSEPPARDERFWDELAAGVRSDYQRQARPRRRRRRWLAAPLVAAVALAAALAFIVRSHHGVVRSHNKAPLADPMGLFDDDDPSELIDELSPAELERASQALHNQGA